MCRLGHEKSAAGVNSAGHILAHVVPVLWLTCTNSLALQHHSVEDEADVLGGLGGAGALLAQQVQDLCGEHRVLAVLDELAQVGQARLLALWVLLNDADDAVHDGPLVLETTLQGEETCSPGVLNTTSTRGLK